MYSLAPVMTVETAPSLRSLRTQTLVGAVSLGHGATHWAVATFFLLLPSMSRDLGLSYTQAGLLATAYYVGSMISNLPSGIVVDLTGKRIRYQLLALLLGSASLAALGTTSSFAALWACLVLLGASNMLWHPAAISYLSIHLPRNRGYSMAIHSLGAHIGDAAGPLAAGWLLLSFSWQRTAQINAVMGVICAGLIVLACGRDDLRSAPRQQPRADYWRGLAVLLKSRAQWSFFLMSGCRTMTQAGLLTFLPLFLANELHMSPVLMGVAMMVLQLGGMVATPMAGVFSDRIGRRPIVLAGMFSTTVIVVLMTFITSRAVYVACISVLGFFLYAMRPVIQAWQMDRSPPEHLAAITSALFTVQAVLSALAPVVGGFLADRFGLISVFYFLAASVLAGNVLCFLVPKTEHGD
ncbi:MAG: MFS transporter [Alphaproteobacteria bacterium]|nr:MFS transporter [Alphaproteobacteria bacterium]